MRNKKGYSEQYNTFRRELLYHLSLGNAALRRDGRILRSGLRACVVICTIAVVFLVTRTGSRLVVPQGNGIWRVALRLERLQVVLPRVQHDDSLALCYAVIDLVRVNGHVATESGGSRASRANCAMPTRALAGACAGACTTVWGQMGAQNEQRMCRMGDFLRTARYHHEVCAAEKDGNDGGSEHREQCWVLAECTLDPDLSISRRTRLCQQAMGFRGGEAGRRTCRDQVIER
jgi:hypothetical protein